MVNIRRGVVPLPNEPLGRAQPTGEVALRPQDIDAGIDTVLKRLGGQFGSLSERIGQLADRAAQREGTEEGRAAGLDPEFRRRQDGTIRGEAYDAAALQVQRAQLVSRMGEDLMQVYRDNRGSPAALDAALQERRRHWLANSDPALTAEVEQLYSRNRLTFMREAAREQDAAAAIELRGSLIEETGTRLRALHQHARGLGIGPVTVSSGAFDGEVSPDDILAREVEELRGRLAVMGPNGRPVLTPADQRTILRQATETVARARVLGTFERLGDPDAQERMLAELKDDFVNSRGIAQHFDETSFENLERTLRAELRRGRVGDAVENREIMREVRDLVSTARQGIVLPDADLVDLSARVAASGDPRIQTLFGNALEMAALHREAVTWPLGRLEQEVAREASRLGATGGTRPERDRLTMLQGLLNTSRTQLAQDPVSFSERTGLVRPTPLDLSGSSEAFAQSLRARMEVAEAVAAHHRVPVRYFTQADVTGVVARMSEGGDQLVAIAGAIASAGGDQAPVMLRQLFDHAPGLATLADLARSGTAGNMATLRDAANGILLRRTEGKGPGGYKPAHTIPQGERATLATEVYGSAFRDMDDMRDATLALADTVYDVRARRRGITTFDADEYRKALRDVVGEHRVDGQRYGGIVYQQPSWVSRGSSPIVIPPEVRADKWHELLDALQPTDFIEARDQIGLPTSALPRPAMGREPLVAIQQGTLVPAGDGWRYYVAMGNPGAPGEERFLMTRPGTGEAGRFVLDLDRLMPVLRMRRPDLFFGAQAGR